VAPAGRVSLLIWGGEGRAAFWQGSPPSNQVFGALPGFVASLPPGVDEFLRNLWVVTQTVDALRAK